MDADKENKHKKELGRVIEFNVSRDKNLDPDVVEEREITEQMMTQFGIFSSLEQFKGINVEFESSLIFFHGQLLKLIKSIPLKLIGLSTIICVFVGFIMIKLNVFDWVRMMAALFLTLGVFMHIGGKLHKKLLSITLLVLPSTDEDCLTLINDFNLPKVDASPRFPFQENVQSSYLWYSFFACDIKLEDIINKIKESDLSFSTEDEE